MLRTYITKRKRLSIQTGYSDAGRFIGQIAANIEIEQLQLKIVKILNEYVKPAVAGDGGNIVFKSFDKKEKRLDVVLQGACSGCPSSTHTLKNGIETMMKEMLPGKVEKVNAING